MLRFAFAAVVAAAFGSAGCTGHGPVASLPSGRTIVVTTDRTFRAVGCRNDDDTAWVTFGPREVVIEPASVVIDGATVASIPEASRTLAVVEFEGRLVVQADGARVYDAEF